MAAAGAGAIVGKGAGVAAIMGMGVGVATTVGAGVGVAATIGAGVASGVATGVASATVGVAAASGAVASGGLEHEQTVNAQIAARIAFMDASFRALAAENASSKWSGEGQRQGVWLEVRRG